MSFVIHTQVSCKIVKSQDDSLLNDLMKRIPGYGGYRERELRRDDDRATRAFLAERLSDCKTALDKLSKKAVADGDFDAPLTIEQLHSRVDHAQSRIRAAVEGYAAWFDRREVDAELLEKIASLDANLISVVDQIDALAQRQLSKRPAASLGELAEVIDLLHSRIDRRNALLAAGQD